MKKISAYLSSIISWGVPWFGKEKKLFLGWIVLWGPYVWQWMKHMVGIYSLLNVILFRYMNQSGLFSSSCLLKL